MAKVIYYVVSLFGLITYTTIGTDAIRVYWNTNTGPIVPPTSTPAPVPKPPFRDPAPVWEDQSDDVPNPNPYVYILPPPSRPKYNDITLEQRKHNRHVNNAKLATITTASPSLTSTSHTGRIIERPEQNNSTPKQDTTSPRSQPSTQNTVTPVSTSLHPVPSHRVPSLAVQYIPNQGFKYYAVVPLAHNEEQSKSEYLKTNDAMLGKYDRYDKPNGRYNAKLKKYKAYEKMKYVPYYAYFDAQKQQYVLSNISPKAVNNQL
ncbi:uncharacterized protein LOC131434598 isoform X2 [Malaya genurostris]|uniref:uncharacterized protein LOC131434598 isoform X2 n=1 Tax=Malaya genurostris TaxID=325434 RepID=UPI0026F38371|nr:uncharacterized protein LOC131434598 isoform X2 [Malaya genurostris]